MNRSVWQSLKALRYSRRRVKFSVNVEVRIMQVQAQTTKAAMMSGYPRDIIRRNKYVSLRSEIRMYKTCARPLTACAIETRAETAIAY